MDMFKKHFETALAMGEKFVDRNPGFCQTKRLQKLEKQYGVSRAYWFLGVFATVALSLYLIGGMALIVNVVGFSYPALASFKAIDSPDALLSKQWLSYWAIFGGFAFVENAFSFLVLAFRYYSLFKAATLVYCFHPTTKGASLLYDSVIYPLMVKHMVPAGSQRNPSFVPAATSAVSSGVSASKAAVSAGVSTTQVGVLEAAEPVTVPPVGDLLTPDQPKLRVVVISASDVVPTEAPGATTDCDPYCVLEVLPEGSRPKDGVAESTKYKTVCKTGTVNPVWNEGVTIPNVKNLDAKLVVTVCNKRAMGRDQCLGKIEVPLSKVKGIPKPVDLIESLSPVEGATEAACGDLRVTVQLE